MSGLAEWSIERRQGVGLVRSGTKEGLEPPRGNPIRPVRHRATCMTGYYRLKLRTVEILGLVDGFNWHQPACETDDD